MNNLEQKLYDYMLKNDVPPDVAERAAAECSRQITKDVLLGGVIAGYGRVILGVMSANPAVVLLSAASASAVGGAAGGTFALLSPACQEVREAAFRLGGY